MGTVTTLNQPEPGFHRRAEALANEITELCSCLYAAEYKLLVKIREFDEKEYWAQQGLCSCAHWLNFKCGIGMNAAREKVRVDHALAKLPKIEKRFAEGALSYSKVRAITRECPVSNRQSTSPDSRSIASSSPRSEPTNSRSPAITGDESTLPRVATVQAGLPDLRSIAWTILSRPPTVKPHRGSPLTASSAESRWKSLSPTRAKPHATTGLVSRPPSF